MTISPSVNSHTFGWVQGTLVLANPKKLIIMANSTAPLVIKAIVPPHLIMAIVEQQLDMDRLWKVVPQTYPVNGAVAKVWINELPVQKLQNRKPPQPNIFFIAGTLTETFNDKFKLLPPKTLTGVIIHGALAERYKIGDVLYTKATLKGRTLHLNNCCSDLEYAIRRQQNRPLTFALAEYPQLLPFSPQRGKSQFWVQHGSEQVAVLVNTQQLQELNILKSGLHQATITGTVERISGLATILNPTIKTSINHQIPSSFPKNDSPRARLLGESLA